MNFQRTEDRTHLHGIHTYYIGTPPLWQSYYIGSYAGIRSDGAPLVGKGLIEKVGSREEALDKIKQKADDRIVGFLHNSMVTTERMVIQNLDDLLQSQEIEFFAQDYHFYYLNNYDQVEKGELSLSINGIAKLVFPDKSYKGSFKIVKSLSLEIELEEVDGRGKSFGEKTYIMASVIRPLRDPKAISAVSLSRNMHKMPQAFYSLLTAPISFGDKEKAFVEKYFEKITQKKMVSLSHVDLLDFYKD